MTELTIPARLVDEGVGLPRMWWDGACVSWNCNELWLHTPDETLDLTDPQTAFGLALKLDEWERSGPVHNGSHIQWTERVFRCQWRKLPDSTRAAVLADMVARLTRIGMDHAIRRKLGWGVEPGTLARFRCTDMGELSGRIVWEMKNGDEYHYWTNSESDVVGYEDTTTHLATLAGITDVSRQPTAQLRPLGPRYKHPHPTEALRAIYEEVTHD